MHTEWECVVNGKLTGIIHNFFVVVVQDWLYCVTHLVFAIVSIHYIYHDGVLLSWLIDINCVTIDFVTTLINFNSE